MELKLRLLVMKNSLQLSSDPDPDALPIQRSSNVQSAPSTSPAQLPYRQVLDPLRKKLVLRNLDYIRDLLLQRPHLPRRVLMML